MSEVPRAPASAIALGVAGALLVTGVAVWSGSLVAWLAALGLMFLTWRAGSARSDEREELARSLEGARVLPQGDEVLIEGLHRGERVWLEQSSAVPGTLCRIACAAAPALRGTIKAAAAGAPPRFVGGPTATLPDALTSGVAGQALRALLARCPFVRIRAGEVEVLVEDARAVPAVVDALAGLTLALRGVGQPSGLEVQLREREAVSAGCPYCREALGESESIACGGCGTQHHLACLLEHGRCTVLACGGGRVKQVREGADL